MSEKFEECLTDRDYGYYVSKELYSTGDFEYRLVARLDVSPDTDNVIYGQINLVPSPKSVARWFVDEFRTQFGDDTEFESDSVGSSWWFSLTQYGFGVNVCAKTYMAEGKESTEGISGEVINISDKLIDSGDEFEYIIKDLEREVMTITGLTGFYLDRAQNRLGTTGWDILRMSGTMFRDSYDPEGLLIESLEDIPKFDQQFENTTNDTPVEEFVMRELKQADDPQQEFEDRLKGLFEEHGSLRLGLLGQSFFGPDKIGVWTE